jgi:hypothetical protein
MTISGLKEDFAYMRQGCGFGPDAEPFGPGPLLDWIEEMFARWLFRKAGCTHRGTFVDTGWVGGYCTRCGFSFEVTGRETMTPIFFRYGLRGEKR